MKYVYCVTSSNAKICPFCKHWYDPANSAIEPKLLSRTNWTVDTDIKSKCMKKNYPTRSIHGGCREFESKV